MRRQPQCECRPDEVVDGRCTTGVPSDAGSAVNDAQPCREVVGRATARIENSNECETSVLNQKGSEPVGDDQD